MRAAARGRDARQAALGSVRLRTGGRQGLHGVAFVKQLHLDALRRRKLAHPRAHYRLRMARHRVHRRAAFEREHRTLLDRHISAGHKAVVDAFLAVAHRELGVGREQECRVVVMGAVVMDVIHARFLVHAEDEAQRVGKLRRLAVELHATPQVHGVQRHHARALVVDDAAAQQIAVLARDLVRLEMPTRARRHHVDVADDAQLLLGCSDKIDVADVAGIIVDLKAHIGCHGERGVKRLARARAVRSALGSCAKIFEAGNAHELVDVGDDILPMLVKVAIDVLLEQLIRRHLRQCVVLNHEVISISCCADQNHPVQW